MDLNKTAMSGVVFPTDRLALVASFVQWLATAADCPRAHRGRRVAPGIADTSRDRGHFAVATNPALSSWLPLWRFLMTEGTGPGTWVAGPRLVKGLPVQISKEM
jgi:hypothetical protein